MSIVKENHSKFHKFFEMVTRWNDMDSMGHINNSVFLTYLESARIDLFKKLDFKDVPFIMASIKLDYLKQIKHPSNLKIGSKISRLGNKSFDIMSEIFVNNDLEPAAKAIIICVCYDYTKQITIPVPKKIIKLYNN